VDGERSPALNLDALTVDDLAGDHRSTAALGAYLDRDAPSDAASGDDPGELGDVVRDLGSGPHGSDARSTPAAAASAGGGHLGSAATTSTGFTVDLWKEGRAHPTWDDLGGVSPRRGTPRREHCRQPRPLQRAVFAP
jgi:hypothetical protein